MMSSQLFIFWQFFKRDMYIQRSKIPDYIINYVFSYPIIFAMQTGYLQANTYFGSYNPQMNTMMYCGNLLLIVMLFTYKQHIELLFDLKTIGYINYQIIVLDPLLVLLEKIIFTSIITCIIVLPFYPMGTLLLPEYILSDAVSWPHLIAILYLASLCCSAYHLMAVVLLPSPNEITLLWSRFNHILMTFGGFWIPWFVLYSYSPVLGYIAYLNPMLYITEGVKGAILGGDMFIPFGICATVLLSYTVIFTIACFIIFKRRVDCL